MILHEGECSRVSFWSKQIQIFHVIRDPYQILCQYEPLEIVFTKSSYVYSETILPKFTKSIILEIRSFQFIDTFSFIH